MQVFMDTLDGKILQDKYRIERFFLNGENSMIFQVTDIRKDAAQRPLVAKIRETCDTFLNEIATLEKLQNWNSMAPDKKHPGGSISEMFETGHFVLIDTKNFDQEDDLE